MLDENPSKNVDLAEDVLKQDTFYQGLSHRFHKPEALSAYLKCHAGLSGYDVKTMVKKARVDIAAKLLEIDGRKPDYSKLQ